MRETDAQFIERMKREKGVNVADIARGREIINRQAIDRIYDSLGGPKGPSQPPR